MAGFETATFGILRHEAEEQQFVGEISGSAVLGNLSLLLAGVAHAFTL